MTDHAVARRTDPSTSWSAAGSVRDLRESQRVVLDAFRKHGPMTDEQLNALPEVRAVCSVSGGRTRRSELVDRGLLEDSGRRARTESGRQTIIWRARDGRPAAAPALPAHVVEQRPVFGDSETIRALRRLEKR